MGLRLWAGILLATGVLAFPAGALTVVQLARRWPGIESPGGLALTVAASWAVLILVALQALGWDLALGRRPAPDASTLDLLRGRHRRDDAPRRGA